MKRFLRRLLRLAREKHHDKVVSRLRRRYVVDESRNMKNVELDSLTGREKKEICDLWCPLVPKKFFLYHQLFKTMSHFDARFVSDEYYYPVLLWALNPLGLARAFEQKSLYPIIYKDIPQPKFYVNKLNGVYYDSDFNVINEKAALSILKTCCSFIIKPTHDSCQGKNVRRFFSDDQDLEGIVHDYGKDFIAQEVLSQSKMTARFNPSSLNSFRLTTLNLNGRVSLCTIVFRCGQGNTCVDNLGAGGLMVGVSEKGEFCNFAYDKNYQRYSETKDGVKFGGTIIPNMERIVETVKGWHSKTLMHSALIGWDIALDVDDNPIMIEVNLQWPGIQFEQLCNGEPLFGDRTQEVIDYIIK